VNGSRPTQTRRHIGRRFVDRVMEREVLEARLAGAASAAGLDAGVIRDTPGKRQHLDFVLVFVIGGLALDVSDFCKNV